MSRSAFETTELLGCQFRYQHHHFQVLKRPKIASMVLISDINRPLSGCLYNFRVHIGVEGLRLRARGIAAGSVVSFGSLLAWRGGVMHQRLPNKNAAPYLE